MPLPARRQLYVGVLVRRLATPARCKHGILAYVIDVQAVADQAGAELARCRDDMPPVVEDEAVQGGAATSRC